MPKPSTSRWNLNKKNKWFVYVISHSIYSVVFPLFIFITECAGNSFILNTLTPITAIQLFAVVVVGVCYYMISK